MREECRRERTKEEDEEKERSLDAQEIGSG